jgi:prepilin-type N-terminal cleavage/methylation domain-containing protein
MRPSATRGLGMRGRRAFTLVEILTALFILSIIGLAFVRLMTSQSRFAEGQMALRNARSVSRNAMNILLTDLRMVQDSGGLVAASRDSVTVNVPVAFGLLCGTAAGSTTISLLPVDSSMTALGWYAGWAYRDSVDGRFRYNPAVTPSPFANFPATPAAANVAMCSGNLVLAGGIQQPGISLVTYGSGAHARSGKVVVITDPPNAVANMNGVPPNAGWPVFLYQQITYKFAGSAAYPGRIGLFRKVKAQNANNPVVDEIIAPFDTSAKFRFFILNQDVAQDNAPATVEELKTVRGLELNLAGSSPRAQQGRAAAQQALVTGVFFKNRRDP